MIRMKIMFIAIVIVIAITTVTGCLNGPEKNENDINSTPLNDDNNMPLNDNNGTNGNGSGDEGFVEKHLHFEGSISTPDCCGNQHWNMTSTAFKIIGTLQWSQTIYDLDFRMGLGENPHNGTVVAKDDNGSFGHGEGKVTLVITNQTALAVPDGGKVQWFAQAKPDPLAPIDPFSLIWKCEYTIDITIYYRS